MLPPTRIAAVAGLSALLSLQCVQAGQLYGGCNAAKTIALTFDDAFQHPQLEDLLADLKTYNIKATFFVVPSGDSSFCSSLQKIVAGGHAVENHSYSHGHPNQWSSSQLQSEIQQVESAVNQCGLGIKMTQFRPPYLESGGSIVSTASSLGYDTITCNVNTEDYNNIPLDQCWSKATAGISSAGGKAIVLHHNWCYKSGGTKGIIQKYSETYKAQGYSFVTVSECIGQSAPTTGPTNTPTNNPTTGPTSTPSTGGAPKWGQCGGNGWTGPTTCAEGTCKKMNDWYSQCQ